MIALKKRLDSLEFSASRYHEKMFRQAGRELGLPLPACSDIADGLVRIKRMIDSLMKLPLKMEDPSAESIVLEFTDWVAAEHARAKHDETK
jgi:hypothetical protein